MEKPESPVIVVCPAFPSPNRRELLWAAKLARLVLLARLEHLVPWDLGEPKAHPASPETPETLDPSDPPATKAPREEPANPENQATPEHQDKMEDRERKDLPELLVNLDPLEPKVSPDQLATQAPTEMPDLQDHPDLPVLSAMLVFLAILDLRPLLGFRGKMQTIVRAQLAVDELRIEFLRTEDFAGISYPSF